MTFAYPVVDLHVKAVCALNVLVKSNARSNGSLYLHMLGVVSLASDDNSSTARLRHQQLVAQMRKLERQEENLLDLVADGALATTKLRSRLIDIDRQKGSVQEEMSKTVDDLSLGAELIGKALAFMEDPAALYRNVSDEHRRLVLAALFEMLYIHQDEIIGAEMREPFGDLQKWHMAIVGQSTIGAQVEGTVITRRPGNDRSAGPGRACASGRNTRSTGVSMVHGLNKDFVVELTRLELVTSCMPCKRSSQLSYSPK